jgi:hypothetical protein
MFRKTIILGLILLFSNIDLAVSGTIHLPQTGQTTCYNTAGEIRDCSGTGQDGDIRAGVAWPDQRFIVSDDCVTDNLTGLMWAGNADLPGGTRNWQDALNYVASINSGSGLCDHHDWRLPNLNEMESLVHAGQLNTAAWLNAQGFINVREKNYWSSTSYTAAPNNAWVVYMKGGGEGYADKGYWSIIYVWPVRSGPSPSPPASLRKTGQTTCYNTAGEIRDCNGTGQDGELRTGVAWPDPRFIVSSDCVTDKLTGLMWARNANLPDGTRNWQDALNYVAAINIGSGLCGHHDWFLPNRKELRSLTDYSQSVPALPLNHPFTSVQSAFYWSSTSGTNSPENAWIVSMSVGEVPMSNKASEYSVWPVREPLSFPVYLPLIMR